MAGYKNFEVNRNKFAKGQNVFDKTASTKKSQTKSEKLMEGVDIWTSFYRSNPHRFAKDFLDFDLKWFQVVLLNMMMTNHYFMFLASRGLGKTWLISVFCIIRAILFPKSKIVIASGQKSQAQEVLVYIDTFRKKCSLLNREIESCNATSATNPTCHFHNGSWIRVVPATPGARSKRANILIIDEFRMVKLDIINRVLRKFLTASRDPKYLTNPLYSHLLERNKEYYLSSCWYKSHWSWEKTKAYFQKILNKKGKNNPYFLCSLPYQLSVKEGLLMKEQVIDEMSEDDFDDVAWDMEMGSLYFGESENAYFKFVTLEKNRDMLDVYYPKEVLAEIKDKNLKVPQKKQNEIRFVSNDIATIGRGQNDASAYVVFSLIPNKSNSKYNIKIKYIESIVGGHTELQAIRIRQLYEDFDCDYIVLDTMNAGIGIYDALCKKMIDTERGLEYSAFSCMNDEELASRCWENDALEVIYSVKGSATLNDQCARKTKNSLITGEVKLPLTPNEAREILSKIKGYELLPSDVKAKLILPYAQTTSLINEMINLTNEGKDGIIKLKEPSTGRKDKYSAFSYGIYFAKYLERENLFSDEVDDENDDLVYC